MPHLDLGPILGHRTRPRDPWASEGGSWHASRSGGTRKHLGVDLVAWPGTPVLAPCSGVVLRIARPYAHDHRYSGFLFQTPVPDIRLKVFYVDVGEEQVGQRFAPGERIGTAQDLRQRYSGIVPHIHVELWEGSERVDPTDSLEAVG